MNVHIIDILVVVAYFCVILYLGKKSASASKNEEGYFLAGRKLGKLYQFFLNFGNATDANGAVSTATLVYQQGASGAWQAFQTVFMNPYYWFMNVWFRRVRLVTVAELFQERLGSINLAKLYAFYQVLYVIFFIGWANLIGYNVTSTLLPKPESSYTAADRQQVEDFRHYRELQKIDQATFTAEQNVDYTRLDDLYKKKQLRSSVSYVQPWQFYVCFTIIVGCYLIMGGMTGAARNEVLQGILIVTFSILLIPFGFHALAEGGKSGVQVLRERVPEEMLYLLGSPGSASISITGLLAILLVSIIQINGIMGNMGVSGSARNEYAARFGAVSGTYAKRLMIIMWSFVGIIGFAYFYGGKLSDPDVVWGELSRQLLGPWPGLFGLMLAGLLAAMMSNIATQSMAASALFVRNVYSYTVTDPAKQKGVLVGQLTIVVVLVLGMLVALTMNDIVAFINVQLTVNVPWGAAIVLMFFWRKLTRAAVWWCVAISAIITIVIPYSVQLIPSLSQDSVLIAKTQPKEITYTVKGAGQTLDSIAKAENFKIEKLARLNNLDASVPLKVGATIITSAAPKGDAMYFAKVGHKDSGNLSSPLVGTGRFNIEVWLEEKVGAIHALHTLMPTLIPELVNMTKADLLAMQFFFDGILPFIVLIVVSFLTTAPEREKVAYFFGKMKTPVGATPELEEETMAETHRNPGRFDHTKIFPHSDWEWTKWNKEDTIGFIACLGVSTCIVFLFVFLLRAVG
jgi:solute:Na+ symporter, SSS family